MSSVQPLLGHFLSKYDQTVLEGLSKLKSLLSPSPPQNALVSDGLPLHADPAAAFASEFISDPQALRALLECVSSRASSGAKATSGGGSAAANTLASRERIQTETITAVKMLLAVAPTAALRLAVARAVCGKEIFDVLRGSLSRLSDATLTQSLGSLTLLASVGSVAPQLVLSRFGGAVPLELACFQSQLAYSLRRVRASRMEFLISLASSKFQRVSARVVRTHGYLTTLLEDAAQSLHEAGGAVDERTSSLVSSALRVVEEHYIRSTILSVQEKKEVLLAQRSIARTLIRALTVDGIADRASGLLYALVSLLIEAPTDYALARTDADDLGMSNFAVFTILRMLRPRNSAAESALTSFILYRCPDLIRPYFVRVSSQAMAEDVGSSSSSGSGGSGGGGNSSRGGSFAAQSMGSVATLNLLTRICGAPVPFYLQAHVGRLVSKDTGATRCYTVTPKNLAEEICPAWMSEFLHRLINSRTNLLFLLWAMQATQAALNRAMKILQLARTMHRSQMRFAAGAPDEATSKDNGGYLLGGDSGHSYAAEDGDVTADSQLVDLEQFEADTLAALEQFLPKREEFWHRMTQQLQRILTPGGGGGVEAATSAPASGAGAASTLCAKVHFVTQRMYLLMDSYTDLFQLRVPWLSAAPPCGGNVLQALSQKTTTTIGKLLESGTDAISQWPAKTMSALCNLLFANLRRGVALTKLHHVNLGTEVVPAGGGNASQQQQQHAWPLLLSIWAWVVCHRRSQHNGNRSRKDHVKRGADDGDGEDDAVDDVIEALAQITRLTLHCVHAVSTRFSAELDEVYLWLCEMPVAVLPCLLHVLNSMHMRSTSKGAERQNQSQNQPQQHQQPTHGTLVENARLLIAKVREKAAAAAAGGGQATNSSMSKPGMTRKNVWQLDLEAHVETFERVVERIVAAWPERSSRFRKEVAEPLMASQFTALRGKRTLEQAMCQPAAPAAAEHLVESVFGLVLRVCWRSDDAEQELQNRMELDDERRFLAALADAADVKQLQRLICKNTEARECLCTSRYAAFALALRVRALAVQSCRVADDTNARSQPEQDEADTPDRCAMRHTELVKLATSVLALIETTIVQLWRSDERASEVQRAGTWLLLVVALQLLLRQVRCRSGAGRDRRAHEVDGAPVVSEECIRSWENLVLRYYRGSLSVTDRLLYTALLHAHYLRRPLDEPTNTAHPDNDDEAAGDGNAALHDDADDDGGGGATSRPARRTTQESFTLSHCMVPAGLQRARFVTSDVDLLPTSIPEVAALAHCVELWTDGDTHRADDPLTLTTALHILGANGSSRAADELLSSCWRAAFPDMPTRRDARIVPAAGADAALVSSGPGSIRQRSVVSDTVVDPRYLLPLAHSVGCLWTHLTGAAAPSSAASAVPRSQVPPPAPCLLSPTDVARVVPPHLLTRCFPRCVKAMSFECAELRFLASACLARMFGFLSPLQRSTVNYLRLVVLQREAFLASRGIARHVDAAPPRIAAMHTAFVLSSQTPLRDCASQLHNAVANGILTAGALDETRPGSIATFGSRAPPLSHLLHDFPLQCVASAVIAAEEQKGGHSTRRQHDSGRRPFRPGLGDRAVSSSSRVADASPHLEFVLSQLSNSGGTVADVRNLIESNTLGNIMTLGEFLSSTPSLRLAALQCLETIVTASQSIAVLCAREGQVLPWSFSFLSTLLSEQEGAHGDVVAASDLFLATLSLLRKLVCATCRTRGLEELLPMRIAMLERRLRERHVSSKAVWDAVEAMKAECRESKGRGTRSHHQN